MKIFTLLAPLMAGALTASAVAPVAAPNLSVPAPQKFAGSVPTKIISRSADGLTADFSRRGAENEVSFWTENFDQGKDSWEFDDTQNVTWTLANPSNSFSSIDPANVNSLFVDGPYQIFKREISSATSPELTVPDNAMLRCYLYFTLNYQDECALEISISDDDFETSTRLYTSLDETGEKPVMWRPVAVSLADFAGKKVKLRFTYTYGRNDETFKTGGYMGSFYIDDIRITAAIPVTSIDVTTGETIDFIDLSSGDIAEWEWLFPGAVPATSSEKNPTVYYTRDGSYDVTLKVRDAAGNEAQLTRPNMVNVTGTEPTAHILPPATFRHATTRKYMVAPMAKVTFADNSDGFPTEYSWQFTGVAPDATDVVTADTESVDVNYWYLHDWTASLEVANSHGSSSDSVELSAEYEGSVCNLRADDTLTTFDLEGRGTFPGSNSMGITAYAEKFSAPSVPSVVGGATVFFTKCVVDELIDQIADVGVHLYTSENGRPGKKIDSFWWRTIDLEISSDPSMVKGTGFKFYSAPVVSDEFFIVVDGIPDTKYEADVAFAMADFRAEGGTSWMLKDGEWIEVSSYFPAGANHTSFAIYPYISHSVMAPIPLDAGTTIEVDADKNVAEFDLFSYMGYETPVSDADWCRVISEPNGLTVDKLLIESDAKPENIKERTAHIKLTDGITELTLNVHQSKISGITSVSTDSSAEATAAFVNGQLEIETPREATVAVSSIDGKRIFAADARAGKSTIDAISWPAGIYIVNIAENSKFHSIKLIKK